MWSGLERRETGRVAVWEASRPVLSSPLPGFSRPGLEGVGVLRIPLGAALHCLLSRGLWGPVRLSGQAELCGSGAFLDSRTKTFPDPGLLNSPGLPVFPL